MNAWRGRFYVWVEQRRYYSGGESGFLKFFLDFFLAYMGLHKALD